MIFLPQRKVGSMRKTRIIAVIVLIVATLILVTTLTSCDSIMEYLGDEMAKALESGLDNLLTTPTAEPDDNTPTEPTKGPGDETFNTPTEEPEDDVTPTTKPTATPTQKPTATPTPKPTPTPTPKPTATPTPKPTATPAPNVIPFRSVPDFPTYKLPKETFTDPIEKEASEIIDGAIERAIATVNVVKDDRHSTKTYAYEYDANGYEKDFTNAQKNLLAELVRHAEKFESFTMKGSDYQGDLLVDALTVSKALMLNHPDIDAYFDFKLVGWDDLRDRYFDMNKDANASVENGKVDLETVKHQASLLDHVIKRIVSKMPAGLTTYDKYFYLASVICEQCTYDTDMTADNRFTPFGALISGKCVCEGYSRAFLLLCREANLWCAYRNGKPGGGGHIWNMVKLDSGIYNVDVTWCDSRDPHSKNWYKYFMKTDEDFVNDGHAADEGVKGTGKYEPNPYTE